MPDVIQADYAQLDTIASQFSALADHNQELQQQLRQKFDSLQSQWIGEGATSFFSEMEDSVFPTLQRLNSALEEGNLTTQQISEIMQNAEADAANAFSLGDGGDLGTLPGITGEGGAAAINPLTTAAGVAVARGIGSGLSDINIGGVTFDQMKGLISQVKGWVKNGVTLAQGSVSVSDSMYSTGFDGWYGRGDLDLAGYSAQANGKVTLGKDGLNAKGSASAEAYLLKAQYRGDFGPLDINADAFVGAEASAQGELKIDPRGGVYNLSASGEAFAGARAKAEGSLDLGPFGSASASAEAWAGIGIKGKADIGYSDGKLSFDLGFGAALGIGAAFDVQFDIDFKEGFEKVKDMGEDIVDSVKDGIKKAGKGIKKVWDSIF